MARLLLSELGVDSGNPRFLCAGVLWRRGHSLWFTEGLWRCFSGAKGRGQYILKLFSDMKGKRKRPREKSNRASTSLGFVFQHCPDFN